MPSIGRAVTDAEGDRFAPAFATPQGNWLATCDAVLTFVFRRLNDRAWAQRWKWQDVTGNVVALSTRKGR